MFANPRNSAALESSKLLIIDDDQSSICLLTVLLRNAGYRRLNSLTDPREAPRSYAEIEPDLILVDILMPYLDGIQVIEALQRRIPRNNYVPIVVLTADAAVSTRQRAFSLGVKDFLTKPFDQTELVLRIGNLIETRLLHVENRARNLALEEQVRQGTSALDEAQSEIIDCLEKVAAFRDEGTSQHCQRVGILAGWIARAIGFPEDRVRGIAVAATLHDIGKIGIPDRILLKPGKLTPEEFDQIRKHTAIGADILSINHFSIVKLAEEIAFNHHERWDGEGYNGLKGEDIPQAARIVTLADTFDVLTHDRPYRVAWPADRAIAEIKRQKGRQFDPRVVDAFLDGFSSPDLSALRANLANLDEPTLDDPTLRSEEVAALDRSLERQR